MKLKQTLRKQLLYAVNRRTLSAELARLTLDGRTPVFFIFTPDLVHLAPYCVLGVRDDFAPIILLNAVSKDDQEWLSERLPATPAISLRTSISNNRDSLLSHPEIIDTLIYSYDGVFCLQDPDCFVCAPEFWDSVKITPDEFAAGPFIKKTTNHDHVLPDTFFLAIDTNTFKGIASTFGISSAVYKHLPKRAQQRAVQFGYQPDHYPEQFKGYFDTLQAYWIISLASGLKYRHIEGAGKVVFHIGGTSYLHKSNIDLAHWDYWPLSVIYFNSRILEMKGNDRFRHRFAYLYAQYSSSEEILMRHTDFASGWRRREIDYIVESFRSRLAFT